MGKIKISKIQNALKRLQEQIKLLEASFAPWPTIIKLPTGIKDLIDELIETEEISEELLKKICEALEERWLLKR